MESFKSEQEKEPLNLKALHARALELATEIERLENLSVRSGENIDAELGSEEYVDYGHMAQARELRVELDKINATLKEIDDQNAQQGNLTL